MADIGSTLREARMRARIDITEVEARTKIRAKYLRALENEEWHLLPGSVYVKSFLRTYGDFLGLDSRLLIDEYKRRYERPSDPEPRPMPTLGGERERSPRGPLLPSWAIVAGVLVAIVAALYFLGSGNKTKTVAPTGVHAGGHHRARRAHAAPPAPPLPQTASLQLSPTGTVYVCLVDGAGKTLIPGKIFNAGQTIPVQHAAKMLLTLGNNSVQMKVNGNPVTITSSQNSIGYLVGPGGSRPLSAASQPKCA